MAMRPFHNLRAYLEQRIERIPECGCWLWTRSITKNGYGKLNLLSSGWEMPHRLSWQIHVGPIPQGMFVLHRCDVRTCCNPNHLFLGSAKENTNDMIQKKRDLRPDGTRKTSKKLTAEQVRLIAHDKRTCTVIAKEHGICRDLVSSIRRGKSYPGVDR